MVDSKHHYHQHRRAKNCAKLHFLAKLTICVIFLSHGAFCIAANARGLKCLKCTHFELNTDPSQTTDSAQKCDSTTVMEHNSNNNNYYDQSLRGKKVGTGRNGHEMEFFYCVKITATVRISMGTDSGAGIKLIMRNGIWSNWKDLSGKCREGLPRMLRYKSRTNSNSVHEDDDDEGVGLTMPQDLRNITTCYCNNKASCNGSKKMYLASPIFISIAICLALAY